MNTYLKVISRLWFFLILLFISLNTIAYAKSTAVLSIVTGDWNQDKQLDSAVLMKNKDHVELYIYLANNQQLDLAIYKKDIVWMGAMEGTEPYLKAKGNGSLFIYSENDSIGRNRWQQTLTIAYRNEAFIVGGYTYSSYDTLNVDNMFSCDLNLFTGKGVKNKIPFKVSAQKIKLNDWTDHDISKRCEEN